MTSKQHGLGHTSRLARLLLNASLAALIGLALAGCGSGATSAIPSTASSSSSPPATNTKGSNTAPLQPVIGTVQDGSAAASRTIATPRGSTDRRSQTTNGITISIQQGSETGAPTGYVRVEQDNSAVTYSGTWTTSQSSLLANYSGGTAAVSAQANATATLTFSGTAVRWVGYSDTFSGIATVTLDGGYQTTVNTYSTLPQSQMVLYSASGLSPTTHTLTITVTGTHSLLALGSNVTVDAFDIQPPPPDTTPPTVAISSPATGATVSGTIPVSANATDNTAVASVQFKLDGSDLGSALTTAPYQVSWDTTSVSNGHHTLTAVATDTAGNSSTSSPVTVTVSNSPPPDTTPPTVSITAPANDSTVSGLVQVSADATDNQRVASVQFQLDGSNLGAAVTQPPYQISWDSSSATNGSHTLTAIATDAAGNTATSSPVTVTVSNTAPPPTVSITTPANGSTVSGTTTVSANAADNGGTVSQVQFELDGKALGAPITQSPYRISWDTTSVANGSHTLTAIATNTSGESTTSGAVTVTVSNTAAPPPPSVAITAPNNGATVNGSVTVSASASDSTGSISQVQFQLDGQNLGSPIKQSPYTMSWNTASASNGNHTLTAIATNSSGESTTSSPVTVTVSNTSGGSTSRVSWNSSQVAYTGTWYVASDPKTSTGTATESNQSGATSTLSFTGTKVTWVSYTGPNAAGIAQVSIDGKAVGTVDTYTPSVHYQAPVFTSGTLSAGNHTLTITVTGKYDPKGNSAYIVVDSYLVTQ